jgi:hypothetical protein
MLEFAPLDGLNPQEEEELATAMSVFFDDLNAAIDIVGSFEESRRPELIRVAESILGVVTRLEDLEQKTTEIPPCDAAEEDPSEWQIKTIPKKPPNLPKKDLSTDIFDTLPKRQRQVSRRDLRHHPKYKDCFTWPRDAFRRKVQDNLLVEPGSPFRGEKHRCKSAGAYRPLKSPLHQEIQSRGHPQRVPRAPPLSLACGPSSMIIPGGLPGWLSKSGLS